MIFSEKGISLNEVFFVLYVPRHYCSISVWLVIQVNHTKIQCSVPTLLSANIRHRYRNTVHTKDTQYFLCTW
jgi:hypothetical protein